tara:strand:- start:62 stop:391 length:330 start_codon:yes stop_codon:yes gene_type:complete
METNNKETKMEKKIISKEERASIMLEVKNKGPEQTIETIMQKYGRTAQTYYNWAKQAKGVKTKASKATKAAKPAPSSKPWVTGVHMPSGEKVRVYVSNATGTPIVMDWK